MAEPKKFKIEYSDPPDGATCPPGFHFVRAHKRLCHSGVTTWVEAHIAKNPVNKTKSYYLSENLYFLFQETGKKTYPRIGKICGFPEYEEVDPLIHFWLDYWKGRGFEFPEDLNPKLVRALIAHESSFNPKSRSKSKNSSATGLMQILNTTRLRLSGKADSKGWSEIKDDRIKVEQEHLFDPLINVACGTRWLAYKYQKIPKGKEKTSFNLLKNYNQWNAKGEVYAKRVFDLYKESSLKYSLPSYLFFSRRQL